MSISERVARYLAESEVGGEFALFVYRAMISPYVFYSLIPLSEMDLAIQAWQTLSKDSLILNLNVFELIALAIEDPDVYELPFIFTKYKQALNTCVEYFVTGDEKLEQQVHIRIRHEADVRARESVAKHLDQLFNLEYTK